MTTSFGATEAWSLRPHLRSCFRPNRRRTCRGKRRPPPPAVPTGRPPTFSTRTSTSTPGTRTRARLVLKARPNHPVSLRYHVRTYTSPTTCTTQIGFHGRSVPSARRTAISSSRAASTRASCSGVQLMIPERTHRARHCRPTRGAHPTAHPPRLSTAAAHPPPDPHCEEPPPTAAQNRWCRCRACAERRSA